MRLLLILPLFLTGCTRNESAWQQAQELQPTTNLTTQEVYIWITRPAE